MKKLQISEEIIIITLLTGYYMLTNNFVHMKKLRNYFNFKLKTSRINDCRIYNEYIILEK